MKDEIPGASIPFILHPSSFILAAMLADAPNLNSLWAALMVEELVRNGVRFFCLSPGSRCAPLTVAVARNARAENVVHFDERGAAYCALGYARATGRPAAVICTSGTAVANCLPAVVEAAMSHVPLILLTADRPPELLDTGANQAIHQPGIFGRYARWEVNLPCPDMAIKPSFLLTTVDHAVNRARHPVQGPVHINCMYREPLAPDESGANYADYLAGIGEWLEGGDDWYGVNEDSLFRADFRCYRSPEDKREFTRHVYPWTQRSPEAESILSKVERDSKKGLLILGQLETRSAIRDISPFAQTLNWPVLADVGSGLRLGMDVSPYIPYYDQLLLSDNFRELMLPDTVIHVGGPLVSKRLLQCIESTPNVRYVRLVNHSGRCDPTHQVTERMEINVSAFLAGYSRQRSPREPSAACEWLRRGCQIVDQAIDHCLERQTRITEPAVARLISRLAPESSALFLGNSMPIRDMNMYGAANGPDLRVVVNRGASGIDGNIATVAGYARAVQVPVTALLGDLAALHDLNSLALLKDVSTPVVLVVLNNHGGGIFSFLPIAEFPDVFERYFGTPHTLSFENAASMFKLRYVAPGTLGEFQQAYVNAFVHRGVTLIEVVTDRTENHDIHLELQQVIISALEQ